MVESLGSSISIDTFSPPVNDVEIVMGFLSAGINVYVPSSIDSPLIRAPG